MRPANLVEEETEEEAGSQKEIGGVWFMGHVSKLLDTHNQFAALEEEEVGEANNQEWETVAPKNKPKLFTRKSSPFLLRSALCRTLIDREGRYSFSSAYCALVSARE